MRRRRKSRRHRLRRNHSTIRPANRTAFSGSGIDAQLAVAELRFSANLDYNAVDVAAFDDKARQETPRIEREFTNASSHSAYVAF